MNMLGLRHLAPAVGGVGPDPAPGVDLVEELGELRAVVARGVGCGSGLDQPVAAVDPEVVLITMIRTATATSMLLAVRPPSRHGGALAGAAGD